MRGFEVWLLNGCGPNLYFPKAFGQSTRFPLQKFGDMSPYNHTRRAKQVYIYIHHA